VSSLSDIRDGIKTVLEAANSKLRVYIYPPDEGVQQKPAMVLEHDDINYHELAIGGNSLTLELQGTLYLQGAQSQELWAELDKYRSPTGTESIKRGIRTDDTLSSKADVAVVVSSSDVQRNRDGTGPWQYSCQFTFEITKSIS
jgi:hypothetical protein